MPFIYSTGSNDQNFPLYNKREGSKYAAKSIRQNIVIAGNANVASKHIITRKGAVTKVTDEELEILQKNPAFKRKVAKGFIVVEKTQSAAENEDAKAKADMEAKDKSAPITPEDIVEENKSKPAADQVKVSTGASDDE